MMPTLPAFETPLVYRSARPECVQSNDSVGADTKPDYSIAALMQPQPLNPTGVRGVLLRTTSDEAGVAREQADFSEAYLR